LSQLLIVVSILFMYEEFRYCFGETESELRQQECARQAHVAYLLNPDTLQQLAKKDMAPARIRDIIIYAEDGRTKLVFTWSIKCCLR